LNGDDSRVELELALERSAAPRDQTDDWQTLDLSWREVLLFREPFSPRRRAIPRGAATPRSARARVIGREASTEAAARARRASIAAKTGRRRGSRGNSLARLFVTPRAPRGEEREIFPRGEDGEVHRGGDAGDERRDVPRRQGHRGVQDLPRASPLASSSLRRARPRVPLGETDDG